MKKGIGALLTTAAFLLLASSAFAQQDASLPISVSPARQQIAVDPGQETMVAVKFYNMSDSSLPGFVKIADFLVEDDKGTPRIIDDVKQASPKFSASAWMSLISDRVVIAQNDASTIQIPIKVPANARPGGRYVAVYFEPSIINNVVPGHAASGVLPRIASLIYIRVNGPITENAFISNLFAKSFYEYGPITATAQIANNGDYHISPRGSFTLTNVLGGVVGESTLQSVNIFPDAVRNIEAQLGEKWMMGQYKITLHAAYGEKNKTMDRSIMVVVFPWRLVGIVIFALIILGVIGRTVYKNIIVKEASLEEELSQEKKEIEKLKKELEKKE